MKAYFTKNCRSQQTSRRFSIRLAVSPQSYLLQSHRRNRTQQGKHRRYNLVDVCQLHVRDLSLLHETDMQLRQEALTKAQAGNFVGAIADFDQLLSRNPMSAVDYNNRGLVHFQAGLLEAAIADYNQALDLNPCLDSVYNNRANYYAMQGNFLEAILDYDTALELNPNNVRAWINQGITFRDLQMYSRAIENFDLALSVGRLEGHIYAERGRTHHLSGDWNWAIADYYQAIALLFSSSTAASTRLRLQVEGWLDELLNIRH